MLWVNKRLEAEQIPIPSSDLRAVRIQPPTRAMVVGSVYVPGREPYNYSATTMPRYYSHTYLTITTDGSRWHF